MAALTSTPLRGAALRCIGLVIVAVALGGCQSPHRAPEPDAPAHRSLVWQGNAVQALAYDLRCDEAFDWRAGCAPGQMRTELEDLREDWPGLPGELQSNLQARARALVERWDGQ